MVDLSLFKNGLLWGLGHLGVTVATIIFVGGYALTAIDHPELLPEVDPAWYSLGKVAMPILVQPMANVWGPWMAEHLSFLELPLFFLNSYLWGLGVVLVWRFVAKFSSSPSRTVERGR